MQKWINLQGGQVHYTDAAADGLHLPSLTMLLRFFVGGSYFKEAKEIFPWKTQRFGKLVHFSGCFAGLLSMVIMD